MAGEENTIVTIAVSKTVPGFEFRATFEGDIEGFRLLQVLVATTVFVFFVSVNRTSFTPVLGRKELSSIA